MSSFSDPRWFDHEAVVERADAICCAVPQTDGCYLSHALTGSGTELDVVTLRIVDGPMSGRHAGLLIWPPRSAADRERALGPLAAAVDRDDLERRLRTATLRCRLETSPYGELEVRRIWDVVEEHPLPDPTGPTIISVPADLLPDTPPQSSMTRVHVIRSADEVQQAVELLRDAAVVGLDIETACTRLPPDQRELRDAFEPWNGSVRLVQVATTGSDGIINALVVDCWSVDPGPLLRLIGDGRRVLAHNGRFEQSWIKYRWDVEFTDLFDTCAWWTVIARHLDNAGFVHGVEDAKLVTVAERFLNVELDKSFQTSDWTLDNLSEGQFAYAGEDAAVLLPLAVLLEQMGETLGCGEQAAMASRAGVRRAAISAKFAAQRRPDEREEALALIAAAASPDDLTSAGAMIRRLVLGAPSRMIVGGAYRDRRAALTP